MNIDQRGFDNQRSSFVEAREAARLLGVKLATVYAYAARGLLRPVPAGHGHGRAHLYARSELELLRARHDARSGHGPVAASALRFGEPVLESALTAIEADGPRYRGKNAIELARAGTPFEMVAELLWTGILPSDPPQWRAEWKGPTPARIARLLGSARSEPTRGQAPLTALAVAVPILAAEDGARHGAPLASDLERARGLVFRMAACLGLLGDRPDERVRAALEAKSVAEAIGIALGRKLSAKDRVLLDRALQISADHELNPSSFASRVAASTGADLYACVSAAIATASGPRHAGACGRVEALVEEAGRPERARAVIALRTGRGEAVPGFGHPLYRDGDPRGRYLLEAATAHSRARAAVKTIAALVTAMRDFGREPPTLDLGLVAVASALRLPPGSATAIYVVGRAAGWIAHALEQRGSGFLVRPRARYVGV